MIIYGINPVLEALRAGRVRAIRLGTASSPRTAQVRRLAAAAGTPVTRVPTEVLEHAKTTLLRDAPMGREYLEGSDIDLSRGLLQFHILLGSWSATGSPKGVIINERCESSVKGLFVAGDLATPSDACSGALTTGYVAGLEAARQAAR
ncbi:MAG: hypothetical protein IH939_15375, partial [Acidobacteria bacterium]|nr:hypothetical protein [Acidobacteriota bacterium]